VVADTASVVFWVAAIGFLAQGASSVGELIPSGKPGAISDGRQMWKLRGRAGDERL
jgi:hypothetical protein